MTINETAASLESKQKCEPFTLRRWKIGRKRVESPVCESLSGAQFLVSVRGACMGENDSVVRCVFACEKKPKQWGERKLSWFRRWWML